MESKILIQVDLEGHSKYMAAQRSKPAAAASRVELAMVLHAELAHHNFSLLSWKGDGGVYHADAPTGDAPADFAVTAAKGVAEKTALWRAKSLARNVLRLRISLHWASDMYTYDEPGYWSSDHLNLFIKYEREIGLSGTVAATDILFQHFSEDCQNLFSFSSERRLGLIREIHYLPLESEMEINRTSRYGFFEWVASLKGGGFDASDQELGPSCFSRGSLGDAAFLFMAPQPESPLSIDLKQTETPKTLVLQPRFKDDWERKESEWSNKIVAQRLQDTQKVSPCSIVIPLSDIPLAILEWKPELWSHVRSFHELLTTYPEVRSELGRRALGILADGVQYPGIVCCHTIVRIHGASEPEILVCQRQLKGPQGMYEPGRWSFSYEEQLKPGESVSECVRRGLREELLGTAGSVGADVKILGAIIEKRILNLAFIALVDVPLTLSEISQYWITAIDKDEHRQLATLPLNRKLLRTLVAGGSLSAVLRASMTANDADAFSQTADWRVHPTSAARMAVALWAHETI